ncbi:translation initiation factor IF-3 [Fastidiosipila sanguinis]|uniref:Translation initiation factor IF-3 n=1 Tax=Fastidiosipila sanguinis TaxID=236753 RepID=A0A2S0KLZ6_9FIRM|nr:translation initiation factor IF-3 [Fastidiosipila sanguinis]
MIAKNKKNTTLTNEDIDVDQLRLIDENGENHGVVSREDALDRAFAAGLDLVLINPNPDNAVAKIMDFGKFQYEQSKKAKAAKKAQKTIDVKEVGLKVVTEKHDFDTKVRHAHRFLKDGNRVKVNIRFRGREMSHKEQGYEMMNKFAEACQELGVIDNEPKMEGRNMTMFLMPRTDDKKKARNNSDNSENVDDSELEASEE